MHLSPPMRLCPEACAVACQCLWTKWVRLRTRWRLTCRCPCPVGRRCPVACLRLAACPCPCPCQVVLPEVPSAGRNGRYLRPSRLSRLTSRLAANHDSDHLALPEFRLLLRLIRSASVS